MRLLIVEDEAKLAEALSQILTRNKYICDIAHDGESGLDCALSGIYDAVILDLMLPGRDGFSVVTEMRAAGVKTPVILLTARENIRDKVKGLDCGADDYMTKPFSSDELLARLRALLRRPAELVEASVLRRGDLSLNLSACELSCSGRSIKLGLKEMQIMEMLLRRGGHVTGKEELLVKVWGYESDAEYNNVEVYISFLRKKLSHLKSAVTIRTVRGIGYVLEEGKP